MEINLNGHHVHVTDSLREYAYRKFRKIERHFDNITRINVTLIADPHCKRAEASIHVDHKEIFAEGKADNLRSAIDQMVNRIDRQVKKQKERLQNHRTPHGSN